MNDVSAQLGESGGFTLIELLVAMAASIVIMFALIEIMISTLDQTQRTFTTADATSQARGALATINNELHSACVAGAAAPVQAGSTANTLNFVSYTGDAASPSPQWHVLSLGGGTLVDTTYGATAADGGWTRGVQQGTNLLLAHVTPQSGVDPFQYYEYQSYPAPDGDVYWTVPDGVDALPNGNVPGAAPLKLGGGSVSSADAQNVVQVSVNLNVEAGGQTPGDPDLASTADPVSDSISLRLTTPPDEVAAGAGNGDYGPCQ